MSSSVKQFAFLFWSSPSSCAQMERKVGSLIKKLFAELWGEFREINKRHVRPLGLGTLENSVKQWENRPSNRENISAAHSPKVQGKETVTKWERGRGAGCVEQSVAALHNQGQRGGSWATSRLSHPYWLSPRIPLPSPLLRFMKRVKSISGEEMLEFLRSTGLKV